MMNDPIVIWLQGVLGITYDCTMDIGSLVQQLFNIGWISPEFYLTIWYYLVVFQGTFTCEG